MVINMNSITRDTVLNEQDFEKIGQLLEADVVTFTDEISDLTTEELKEKEAELMETFKENETYLSEVQYELASSVEYDGTNVKRSDIASKVIGFLNRIEVPFQASLGLYQCIRFWKTAGATPDTKIPYGAYDSTLRLLGQLKFKGETDCFDILVVNNWFATAHDGYKRDNIWTQYLSAKHQAIMTALENLEKANAEAEATQDTQV